jgi:hypothetical protein
MSVTYFLRYTIHFRFHPPKQRTLRVNFKTQNHYFTSIFVFNGTSSSTYLHFLQKLIKILYTFKVLQELCNEWGKYSIEYKKIVAYIKLKINNKLHFLSLFCSEVFVSVSQYRNLIRACKMLSDNTEDFTIPRLRTAELI